ncbi:hypothetical protein CERZMDRAFT_93439 [Cercospora zeae-maydis SCOH1-5]|uniref:F-box domain-containing protein n=1 Tax=Cercospora zeae-maydis SCOH1-5 TaxID=717836 RepID=A0A6A6FRX1_9PEZI|nr:hypothetical protein CERZMDRAFT_93439 [Cercospora zeae-maydis SCOH1-5]
MGIPTTMPSPNDKKSADSRPTKPVELLDLPAELKLQVLSNLPGKDIQTCRRVCGEIKELIDSKDNERAITAPILRRAGASCKSFVDISRCRRKNSLPSFLFAWLSRRGLWQDINRTRWLILVGVQQWAFQTSSGIRAYFGTNASRRNGTLGRTTQLLKVIAEALAQVYIDLHYPDLFTAGGSGSAAPPGTPTRMCNVRSKAKFLALVDSRFSYVDLQFLVSRFDLPLSRAQLKSWYVRMKRRVAPRARILYAGADNTALLDIPRGPSPRLAVPQFVLTGFTYFYQDQDQDQGAGSHAVYAMPTPVWVQGRCTTDDLNGILKSSLALSSSVSPWCVKSKWADELICQALGGRQLTKLEIAAVADELYVF